jgi:hypothetical protein
MKKTNQCQTLLHRLQSAGGGAVPTQSTGIALPRTKGQAFIPVLILLVIIITLGTAVLSLSVGGMLISYSSQEGERVLLATEGAIENGLLRNLREPAYTGESLQVGGLPCTIVASGPAPIVVTAECRSDQACRRLEAEAEIVMGEIVINSLKEIE